MQLLVPLEPRLVSREDSDLQRKINIKINKSYTKYKKKEGEKNGYLLATRNSLGRSGG